MTSAEGCVGKRTLEPLFALATKTLPHKYVVNIVVAERFTAPVTSHRRPFAYYAVIKRGGFGLFFDTLLYSASSARLRD